MSLSKHQASSWYPRFWQDYRL